MRRLFPFAALGLAACATTPPQAPVPAPVTTPVPTQPAERGTLIGLSQAQLVARFGAPSFQVREGPGLKLQWQSPACVLDAYLYPPERGAGPASVLHVDTRRPLSGESLAQDICLASFTPPRP